MSDENIKVHDIIAIGAGPAALTAAIYAARENLDIVLIEKGVIGGLAAVTDHIDNFPGFADGVAGLKLASEMRAQAERFGATIELDEISKISKTDGVFELTGYSETYRAKAVLIATGSDYNKLKITGEEEYYGRGVHYCATCDGAFYQQKKLIVVGSGNSAAQEALFLTRFASEIDILIRGDHWKASDVLIEEVEKHPKISVHFNIENKQIVATDGKVSSMLARDKATDKEVSFAADGVFVFVGLKPNTAFLQDSDVELDELGFVKANDQLETNVEGIYVAGDVRSGATMQIAAATGEGAIAALKIREHLEGLDK
jgi:thioredoxin reductase (NADPH)